MTITVGNVNSRTVLYFDVQAQPKWTEKIPEEGWILLAIADENQTDLIDQIAKECIAKNVTYVCGVGKGGSYIDDAFDWEIISRDLNGTLPKNEVYKDGLMTTWHKNIEEGFWFWFASSLAYHEKVSTNVIVCLNLTPKSCKDEITKLIKKVNSGWLPQKKN